MILPLLYAGQNIAVLGLGKSGLSAAKALKSGAAKVIAWDDDEVKRAQAEELGITVADPLDMDVARFAAIVWSPGIPHTLPKPHPLAVKAREQNVPLICDVDILLRTQLDAAIVGITGTNGKSTTTALLAHVLKSAGRPTEAGGNIGKPALDMLPMGLAGTYVLELSSYQLELVPSLRCDVAIFLNITPDHLDRHGDMDGYVAAKMNIFNNQGGPDVAIVGVDDPFGVSIADKLTRTGCQQVIPISVTGPVQGGVFAQDGLLMDSVDGDAFEVMQFKDLPLLPGDHNAQNIAAVYAAARSHGVHSDVITAGLATFKGLPHRQEFITALNGVLFINDSKATNAEAAAKALSCYDDIYWVAGGIAKSGGIKELKPFYPRIRHAYLIGEAADAFADELEPNGVSCTLYEDLETAVEEATAQALKDGKQGAAVLLAPACASFDMFGSFEERGDVFRTEVQRLVDAAREEIA